MIPFRKHNTSMNRIFILRFSLFSLLLFEIANVCVSVSPDELNVPYVPYVVVDKNKDEFDYDRLQQTIVKYLENRSQRQAYTETSFDSSTSLYDYFKTSTSANIIHDHNYEQAQDSNTRLISDQVYQEQPANSNIFSSQISYQPHYKEQTASKSNTGNQNTYQQSSLQHHKSADTRSINVYPFGVSDIHPAYYANVYKPGTRIKNNSEVTANIKITTFQPHRYLTTPLPAFPYANVSSIYRPAAAAAIQYSSLENVTPKFVPLKSVFKSTFPESKYQEIHNANSDLNPLFKFPFNSEMQCSLRSSRYVYDGDCVSKKPVVETVCADRCIKYEISGTKKPFLKDTSLPPKLERQIKIKETKKKAVALTCKDGDVKKQKIKLYCKDGTIINNIIRIVNNCICQEHNEKVQTTKRSHNKYMNSRTRMMSRSPVRVRVRV